MRVRLSSEEPSLSRSQVVVRGLFERPVGPSRLPPDLRAEDRATQGALGRAWTAVELRGSRKEITTFHRSGPGPGRLVLIGLGARGRYDAEVARRASAEVVRALAGRGARSVTFALESFLRDDAVDQVAAVRAVVDGAGLGSYQFARFKTKAPDAPIEEAVVAVPRPSRAVRAAFREEADLVDVVRWTRDIANLPACDATPARLAREAQALGRSHRLRVRVFDERALARMGCGGILAVGGGSTHPPRMITLEYPGRGRSPPTIAVVGKGITFDSGGISIKPAASMSHMKFDKSGAVAVLGILRAARVLNVRPRVIGVMGCAENLPSGSAYRPGDVVRTYSGRTIEVLNTDAEGRVVLSDALAYAAKNYRPDALIDLATLTGAQSVALGDTIAGMVSTDDALAARLADASARSGEAIWRMPLTDYHRELVRAADFGDVRNSIEIPLAGMLTAAAFLETFTLERPWAHLDIAGTGRSAESTRYLAKGGTGFGVRLLADLATSEAFGRSLVRRG